MTRPFSGAMRHRLTLEGPIDAPDGTRSYTDLGRVTAKLRSFGEVEKRYEVLMRPREDLSVEMRFRYRTLILQIVSIDRYDRWTNFLRVRCARVPA